MVYIIAGQRCAAIILRKEVFDKMDQNVYTKGIQEGMPMVFYSVRDLRTEPKKMWEKLSEGEDVVITNNGKPSALMIDIPEDGFEEVVRAVRQARAMIAFNSMRTKAQQIGSLSDEEIDAVIAEVRGR